jgi:hypothetical protein
VSLSVALVGSVAWAETPSPARRCADAAVGTEVEVCLRLAVENPKAVVEIAAALIARMDKSQAPDRELLDALLMLGTPEQAMDGARLLGTLEDPRAAPILVQVAEAGPNDVAVAAIVALVSHPEQVPVMAGWLVERDRPLSFRLALVNTLGEMESPAAADALVDALRRPGIPPVLRSEIQRTLLARYPDVRIPLDIPPKADGAPWLATGASLGLAYTMGAAGHFGRVELWPVGALTGGMAGASFGYLYGRAWPIEAADAAFIATIGVGGIASGVMIGLATREPGDETVNRPLLFGLAGEVVGFAVGPSLAGLHKGTAPDQVEAMVFAAALGVAGEAASRFATRADLAEPKAAWTAAGVAGGFVVGELVAPLWTPEASLGLLTTGVITGTLVGVLIPIGDLPRGELPVATALGGAALGAVLSGPLDPEPDVLFGGATGAVFGAGLGAGLAMIGAPDTPDLARGLALGGMLGGYGIGAVVASVDPDPIDDRDVGFTAACAGWAAVDAYAIAELAGADRQRQMGAVLLGAGAVSALSVAGNLELDIPVPHTLSASSIGLWGGYAGLAVGELTDLEPVVLALPLSNVGWMAGGLLVSPLVGTPPLVIGIADAGGVFGAAVASIGAGLATDDPDVVVLGSVVGAGVGLAGGALLGARWLRSANRWDTALRWPGRDVHSPPVVSLLPMPVQEGMGATLSVTGW